MDTKKLRQKILDLAIRGKLVPQDPNDEPASVLLERIRAEKEQLIKEGKIKRAKKSAASDTSHYENVPYVIPVGWVWCRLEDIAYVAAGSTPSKESFVENGVPYIKMYNLRNQKIDFEFHPQYITEEVHNNKLARSRTQPGDLLMNIVGPPLGKLAIIPESLSEANFNQAAVLIRPLKYKPAITKYLFYYLSELSEINSISTKGSAGQVNISLTQSQQMRIALPPLAELERITQKIESLFSKIDVVKTSTGNIYDLISKIKSSILEKALSGKLVSQDKTDEPAIRLLKSINPNYDSTDNRHYRNVPKGWAVCKFEDILEYEQPQQYIVNSTDYSDEYEIPVLTAGKSFIIGKTNEKSGVYKRLPVIIFDDFTTDSKYVDFPFKVKSSAIKILHAKGNVNPQYIAYLMSVTRLIGDTHKRYWISEYSKIPIMLPPVNEQEKIVSEIEKIYERLNKILAEL